ncbi:MAG: energy transducer TonB [Verrucomicrobia bacterium]|jgi:TonB family protein|nr:energy transducer TonB [Verrucomicrobiota bacterium]OQC66026.1 MAG: hypothetical protein BWX48_01956 [Verrucomicrobia bacterium ADurb.Bin006]MDI9382632.1 energy transducer TonB [Verrucomicrobiota bacterium]NMD19046.1 energy transducer TonB [Verrucomicrobiota bacterium]HNU99229.1 energy transducer TonB [Verrucomicrobiota bacterium]
MNPHAPHGFKRWDRARWWGSVAGVFLLQVIIILVLSPRPPLSATPAQRLARLRLITQPISQAQLESRMWLSDPAEIALVSARGFSGPVWLQLPRMESGLRHWTEPPRWLTQDVSRLATLPILPETEPVRFPLPAAPAATPFLGATSASSSSAPPQSTVRVEGDLARRRRLDSPELPSWPYNDVLAATTVQLVVDRNGSVLAANLLTRSGLPAADQRALELARAAQFEQANPASGASSLTWGQMMFQWQAVPPATNAP